MFRPLQSPPQIEVCEELAELDLSDLELNLATRETIQERAKAKARANKAHFKKALAYLNGLFTKAYGQLARTANFTSDSIHVFLKLYSVNDVNQCRMVRSKMANIFKPVFRRHLLKQSSDPSQGIFGGGEAMFKNMEESKK